MEKRMRKNKKKTKITLPIAPQAKKSKNDKRDFSNANKRKGRKKWRIIITTIALLCILTVGVLGFSYLHSYIPRNITFFVKANSYIDPMGKKIDIFDIQKGLSGKGIVCHDLKMEENGNGIECILERDIQVYFSLNKEVSYQVSSLQALVRRLTIDTITIPGSGSNSAVLRKPKSIDFRHNKPIVSFE